MLLAWPESIFYRSVRHQIGNLRPISPSSLLRHFPACPAPLACCSIGWGLATGRGSLEPLRALLLQKFKGEALACVTMCFLSPRHRDCGAAVVGCVALKRFSHTHVSTRSTVRGGLASKLDTQRCAPRPAASSGLDNSDIVCLLVKHMT
jgi:hypothetical protein